MSKAKNILKILEDVIAAESPVSVPTMASMSNTPPADKNGIVPDKSLITKDDEKKEEKNEGKRFFTGQFAENENPIKVWTQQLKMDMNPDKIISDQKKLGEIPLDIANILLEADPASINSFVYSVQNTEIDKFCKILCRLKDGITVVMRSGSDVVFKDNEAFSFNRDALVNLLVSSNGNI